MVLILFTLCYLALAACNAAVEARTVLALPMFGGEPVLPHCFSRDVQVVL
jgi:hypothetical protein